MTFHHEHIHNMDWVLIVGGLCLAINVIGLCIFAHHGHDHGHHHGDGDDAEHGPSEVVGSSASEDSHGDHEHSHGEGQRASSFIFWATSWAL